jgi:hypothetical protein
VTTSREPTKEEIETAVQIIFPRAYKSLVIRERNQIFIAAVMFGAGFFGGLGVMFMVMGFR